MSHYVEFLTMYILENSVCVIGEMCIVIVLMVWKPSMPNK